MPANNVPPRKQTILINAMRMLYKKHGQIAATASEIEAACPKGEFKNSSSVSANISALRDKGTVTVIDSSSRRPGGGRIYLYSLTEIAEKATAPNGNGPEPKISNTIVEPQSSGKATIERRPNANTQPKTDTQGDNVMATGMPRRGTPEWTIAQQDKRIAMLSDALEKAIGAIKGSADNNRVQSQVIRDIIMSELEVQRNQLVDVIRESWNESGDAKRIYSSWATMTNDIIQMVQAAKAFNDDNRIMVVKALTRMTTFITAAENRELIYAKAYSSGWEDGYLAASKESKGTPADEANRMNEDVIKAHELLAKITQSKQGNVPTQPGEYIDPNDPENAPLFGD